MVRAGSTALDALHVQAFARPGQGGRRVLAGRKALQDLLENSGTTPRDTTRRLTTPEEIREVLGSLGSSIRSELLGLLPAARDPLDAMISSRESDLDLMARGVRMRLIYEPSWLQDTRVVERIVELVDAGAEARVIDRVPHRLMICDRRVALLPTDVTGRETGAIVINEGSVLLSLRALFTGIWQRAEPVTTATPLQPDGGRTGDRAILELMSTGVTDDLAARSLDVSVRTYRRHVADLMNRLGARSRFQAGVAAVERGWL